VQLLQERLLAVRHADERRVQVLRGINLVTAVTVMSGSGQMP
jgi:hypothetical protein